jgi:hypothetical protein
MTMTRPCMPRRSPSTETPMTTNLATAKTPTTPTTHRVYQCVCGLLYHFLALARRLEVRFQPSIARRTPRSDCKTQGDENLTPGQLQRYEPDGGGGGAFLTVVDYGITACFRALTDRYLDSDGQISETWEGQYLSCRALLEFAYHTKFGVPGSGTPTYQWRIRRVNLLGRCLCGPARRTINSPVVRNSILDCADMSSLAQHDVWKASAWKLPSR